MPWTIDLHYSRLCKKESKTKAGVLMGQGLILALEERCKGYGWGVCSYRQATNQVDGRISLRNGQVLAFHVLPGGGVLTAPCWVPDSLQLKQQDLHPIDIIIAAALSMEVGVPRNIPPRLVASEHDRLPRPSALVNGLNGSFGEWLLNYAYARIQMLENGSEENLRRFRVVERELQEYGVAGLRAGARLVGETERAGLDQTYDQYSGPQGGHVHDGGG